MTRLLAALGLCVALLLGGASAVRAAETKPNGQQVLVLLRMTPEHFRPNTDYGGSYGDGVGQRARQRIADRLAKDYGLVRVDNWAMPALGVDCFILDVPDGQSPVEVAEKLSHDARVEWSQPMNLFFVQGGPGHNDPLYKVQPAASEWNLAELHQMATGKNVKVAVIDSRIDRAHPDLQGQIEVSEDFAADHADGPEQHGTGVAGVIAAIADNDMGIVGVAPRSRLMALRACWQQPNSTATVCNTLSLAKALDFAVARNAQVINMSLSGPPDLLLGRLIDLALAKGTVVVGAYDPSQAKGGFPASHAGVIAVADESQPDRPAGVYSAPGRDIPTTQPGGRWFLVNGSSYAAAHVSGLFALMRERGPLRLKDGRLISVKADGAVVDACASLMRTALPCACSCTRAAAK